MPYNINGIFKSLKVLNKKSKAYLVTPGVDPTLQALHLFKLFMTLQEIKQGQSKINCRISVVSS